MGEGSGGFWENQKISYLLFAQPLSKISSTVPNFGKTYGNDKDEFLIRGQSSTLIWMANMILNVYAIMLHIALLEGCEKTS